MAYETASASSVNDLLDKLRVFALAQGWTVDFFGARGAGTAGSQALLLSKSSLCYGFFTDTSVATGDDPGSFFGCAQYPGPYNSGQLPTSQTNISAITWANNMVGPFQAYHFFAGVNEAGQSYLHVVVEVQPGSFRHIGIGVINKMGAITTGAYNYGGRWNYQAYPNYWINSVNYQHTIPWDSIESNSWRGTTIRCDSDSISPKYGYFNQSMSVGTYARVYGGIFYISASEYQFAGGLARGPSTLTGRAVLIPIFGAVHRPGDNYSMLGGPPDIRFVNIRNLLPGELIALGPDSWKVFPILRKNGASGLGNSGEWGYAYRVIA